MKTKLEGSLNIPLSKNSRLSSAPVPLVGGKVCRMVLFNMRLGQSYDFVLTDSDGRLISPRWIAER